MGTNTKYFICKAARFNSFKWCQPVSYRDDQDITCNIMGVYGETREEAEANAKRIVEAWNNFDEMKKQQEDNHTSLLSIYNLVQSHFSEEGLQQLRSDMKANIDLLAKISSNK